MSKKNIKVRVLIILISILVFFIIKLNISGRNFMNNYVFTSKDIWSKHFFAVDLQSVESIELTRYGIGEKFTGDEMIKIIDLLNNAKYSYLEERKGRGGGPVHSIIIKSTETTEIYFFDARSVWIGDFRYFLGYNYLQPLIDIAETIPLD